MFTINKNLTPNRLDPRTRDRFTKDGAPVPKNFTSVPQRPGGPSDIVSD